MKEIKNVLVCGIGAVGSIYADKIEKFTPQNLRVLVDEARLERYKKIQQYLMAGFLISIIFCQMIQALKLI